MSDNSNWQLLRIRLALALCMLFISLAANSQGNSKGTPPADNNPCDIAAEFQNAGMYDQAIAKYDAILKDANSKEEVLKCARTGLVQATKERLEKNCPQAKQALDNGNLSEAEALYKKLAVPTASKEDISCAKEGLKNVAIKYAERGRKREANEDFEAAVKWYQAAKGASSDYLGADDDLIKVSRKSKRKLLTSYTDLGYENEAETKLKEYIKDPMFAEDAKDFAFINRPQIPFWRELRATQLKNLRLSKCPLFSWLPAQWQEMSIIEALIVIGLIWLIGHKFVWGTPTLIIKSFSIAGSDGQNTNADTDQKPKDDSSAFATELEHRLIDFSRASRTNRQVLMVSAPIAPITVDLSTDIPLPKGWAVLAKGLQKLISYFLSRQSLIAKINFLHPPKNGDVIDEVTIQLERGNRIIAKHTLRASDFKFGTKDAKDTDDDLIDCAAIWLLFQLQTNPVQWSAKFVTLLRKLVGKPRRILGTADWEAYAWFLLGDKRCQGEGLEKAKSAKAAYLKSLSLDPGFLACRINLAGVYQQLADYEHDVANKKSLMKDALRQLQSVELCAWRPLWQQWIGVADPNPFTGLFRKAAINFELAGLSDNELQKQKKEKYIHEALKETVDLVKWIRRTQRCRVFNQDLMRYLNWRRPIAECMELGLTVASPQTSENSGSSVLNDLTRVSATLEERVDFYSLYNLACTYALFAAQKESVTESDYFLESMNLLERCLEITANMEALGTGLSGTCARGAVRAKNDYAFKPFKTEKRFLDAIEKHLPKGPQQQDSSVASIL